MNLGTHGLKSNPYSPCPNSPLWNANDSTSAWRKMLQVPTRRKSI